MKFKYLNMILYSYFISSSLWKTKLVSKNLSGILNSHSKIQAVPSGSKICLIQIYLFIVQCIVGSLVGAMKPLLRCKYGLNPGQTQIKHRVWRNRYICRSKSSSINQFVLNNSVFQGYNCFFFCIR